VPKTRSTQFRGRTSLRAQIFWACCGILLLLAAVFVAVVTCFLAGVDAAETPERLRLLWQAALACWVVALIPIWLIARLESRWVVRRVQEPIAALVRQCEAIREGRAAPRLSYDGSDVELDSLAAAVNDLLKHLNGFVVCQHRFAVDAAHELRTPLTAQIVVGEHALARRCSSAELREVVGSMLEESKHMRRLIENLLELARASAVASVVDDKPARGQMEVELGKLAQGCVESLQVLAEEKRQRLELSATVVWANADLTLVRQALLNVIHNAIEHCPEGTRINVITGHLSCDQAMIRVRDNGPGISLEHQAHVFKRFYRGSGSGARRGLGLGLSIAEALLRSQRGHIHLASEPGAGCCFTLTLPRIPEPALEPASACRTDAEGGDLSYLPNAV
jgi:signal transduction histidine kinase